jgi:hypothetical protein
VTDAQASWKVLEKLLEYSQAKEEPCPVFFFSFVNNFRQTFG